MHAQVQPVISPAYHAGVLKGAPHPNAAHLFAVFLTTAEAQELWENTPVRVRHSFQEQQRTVMSKESRSYTYLRKMLDW